MRFHEIPWGSVKFYEIPRDSMRFCEVPWGLAEFCEVPWHSMMFYGILWGFMRFYDVPVNWSIPTEANRGLTSYKHLCIPTLMQEIESRRVDCLYRQTAGFWNALDTLSNVIICNHLSATRRFCHVPEPSMRFHEVLQGSMRFHDISVNQSVYTEANRGLTSYNRLWVAVAKCVIC
jgi:hypothetical protein